MFERYTEKARRVIFFARYEAQQYGSPFIETEYLLLAISRETPRLLVELTSMTQDDVSTKLRAKVEKRRFPHAPTSTSMDLPLSNESKRVLAFAGEEADKLNERHIDSKHLLIGLLRERESFASSILADFGITLEKTREYIQKHNHWPSDAPRGGVAMGSSPRIHQTPPSGGIIEFFQMPNNELVGIVGLRAIVYLPRVGDTVELHDVHLGRRRFHVKEIVHVYQPLVESSPYRNQQLNSIRINVELVEGSSVNPGYETMT